MSSDIASDAAAPAGLSGHAFSSLFHAVDGLRNRRAIVAMLGCVVVGVVVVGLLVAMAGTASFVAGLLATLVWVVAIGTGVNAAGLLHMDHARGISPRSIADALAYGLMCIPKLIVLGLVFVAFELAVFIAIGLLLLLCKIPFLGPLLFVVVFPLSVVVAGVTVTGLFLCMVLSLPAIWQGATITRALAQTFAIVKSRLVEAVLLLVFVGFLCFAVAMIIFGVIVAGLVPTLGMSVSIVGFGGLGMESIMAMPPGYGSSGHAIAGAIGGALLWAVAASLVAQVYLLGLSLVYLRVTEGLDLTASEAALRATFDDARRRTVELGEKARQAAHRDSAGGAAGSGAGFAAGSGAGFSAGSGAGFAATGAVASTGAAATPPPPAYHPPPAFAAPGAQGATPGSDFDDGPRHGADDPTTAPTLGRASDLGRETATPGDDPDIALPFDETTAPEAAPVYAAPPAWSPPRSGAPIPAPSSAVAPGAAPLPAAAPLPPATTCPQCLSPVTPEDAFCGLCGYRLR